MKNYHSLDRKVPYIRDNYIKELREKENGIVKRNVEPSWSSDSTVIAPPIFSTIIWQIASPSPVVWDRRVWI